MILIEEQIAAINADGCKLTITAGAGAGKTGVLVERYLRHILEQKGNPDQILAITFTRKAAADMKKRIVARLREAGKEEEARRAQVGPISTIHGYCERLLREYPFDAGVDPKFEVLSENQSGEFVRNAARQALSSPTNLDECEKALVHALGGERNYHVPAEEVSSMLLHWIGATLDKFRTAGGSADILHNLSLSDDHIQRKWHEYIDERLQQEYGEELPPGWQNDPTAFKAVKKRVPWAAKIAKLDDNQATAELTRGLASLTAKTWRALQSEFDRLRCLDFTELEARACKLLESRPEVLQGKYRWLMVDEAQDVNPMQYRILNATPADSYLLVGDPQQSIYGFRGTEREHFINYTSTSVCNRLTTNFRSSTTILSGVEKVFSRVWPDTFVKMVSPNGNEPNQAQVEVWKTVKPCEKAVADGVLQLISEGVPPREITVLVRMGNSVDQIVSALRNAGQKVSVLSSGSNYFLRSEIRDLGSALQAIAEPNDNLALLSLLRSPLVGLSLDAVMQLGLDARSQNKSVYSLLPDICFTREDTMRLQQFLSWFTPLAGKADRIAAWEALSEIFAATLIDARFAQILGAEQLIANSRKLLSIAIERRDLDARGFGDWIAAQQKIRTRVGDAESISADSDAVTISTMHNAKGLEWETVVVQAVSAGSRRQEDFAIDAEAGILAVKQQNNIPAAFHAIEAKKDRREREEAQRLLYVAMTRAKRRLCIAVCEQTKDEWFSPIVNALAPRFIPTDCVKVRDLTQPQKP